MGKFCLSMEPALPRADSELIHFAKEQIGNFPVDKGLLSSILDSFPYYILVFNDHCQIAYANLQFSQLVGTPVTELLGMEIHEFAELYIQSKPYDFSRLPRILAGETITGYHYELLKNDGTTCTLEFNSYPLRSDVAKQKNVGCLILICDGSAK